MTIEEFVDKCKYLIPFVPIHLGHDSRQQYAIGYSNDDNGYYTYSVDERQLVHKEYHKDKQECLQKIIEEVRFELENNGQVLENLSMDANGEITWLSKEDAGSNEIDWVNKEIDDNLGTKQALQKCCETLGCTSIYTMLKTKSFREIVDTNILNYEQTQVLDIVHSEVNEQEDE